MELFVNDISNNKVSSFFTRCDLCNSLNRYNQKREQASVIRNVLFTHFNLCRRLMVALTELLNLNKKCDKRRHFKKK